MFMTPSPCSVCHFDYPPDKLYSSTCILCLGKRYDKLIADLRGLVTEMDASIHATSLQKETSNAHSPTRPELKINVLKSIIDKIEDLWV